MTRVSSRSEMLGAIHQVSPLPVPEIYQVSLPPPPTNRSLVDPTYLSLVSGTPETEPGLQPGAHAWLLLCGQGVGLPAKRFWVRAPMSV